MKKETKEKIKNWLKSDGPYLAVATTVSAGMLIVFKKYLEESNAIYKEQMQQRTDNTNQNYINYLRTSLDREFEHHHSED